MSKKKLKNIYLSFSPVSKPDFDVRLLLVVDIMLWWNRNQ